MISTDLTANSQNTKRGDFFILALLTSDWGPGKAFRAYTQDHPIHLELDQMDTSESFEDFYDFSGLAAVSQTRKAAFGDLRGIFVPLAGMGMGSNLSSRAQSQVMNLNYVRIIIISPLPLLTSFTVLVFHRYNVGWQAL